MLETYVIAPDGTPERLIQRLENATPGNLFYCEADREEAVEIAQEEFATARAEARAEGRRQGLEEALVLVKDRVTICASAAADWLAPFDADGSDPELAACMSAAEGQCQQIADAISDLLATNTPETQKPETGESDR